MAAALAAGRVDELWVEADRSRHPDVAPLVARARGLGLTVHIVAALDHAETQAPQGVVARARPLPVRSLDDLVGGDAVPAVMVLDHVVDPHNLGAVARSVQAAGLSGLVIASRRAAPLSAVALKAAAGALERLPVAVVGSVADAVARLGKAGLWVIGLEASAPTPLFGLELLAQPVALVCGEEGGGLSRLVSERCDLTASIPLATGSESLNVSVAAALASFEVLRVRAGR